MVNFAAPALASPPCRTAPGSDAPAGTCGSELALYTSAAAMANVAPQLTAAISLRMIEVTMASASASVVYARPAGATLIAAEMAVAQGTIPPGQTGIVVTVYYVHAPVFFAALMTPILGAGRTVSYTLAQVKS